MKCLTCFCRLKDHFHSDKEAYKNSFYVNFVSLLFCVSLCLMQASRATLFTCQPHNSCSTIALTECHLICWILCPEQLGLQTLDKRYLLLSYLFCFQLIALRVFLRFQHSLRQACSTYRDRKHIQ